MEKNKNQLQQRIFTTKYNQQEIDKDKKLEKVAQMKLHDVAK
jgi:hypothetical protein